MKPFAFFALLALFSCAPAPQAWLGTPNPLDVPATVEIEPPANGRFGPFGTAPAGHRNFTGSP